MVYKRFQQTRYAVSISDKKEVISGVYISSRNKQQILGNCDHDIVYVIVKYNLALLKNVLVSQLVILCGAAHINQLIKKCNSYLFLLPGIKVFYVEGTKYCFTTLTFYIILIYVVLYGVTVVLHWKINL